MGSSLNKVLSKNWIVAFCAICLLLSVAFVYAQGVYVGSINSDVYHYPTCTWADRINEENKVWFSSAQDAVNQGYRPCQVCNPPLPQALTPTPSPSPTSTVTPTPSPITSPTTSTNGPSLKVDKTSTVLMVVDGDTFDLTTGETIRLADIDTPEQGEEGYTEAKNYMIDLVEGKTVYIDIDDVSRTDSYGRLVCVVYVKYNSTHCINVNEALLCNGYAVEWDHSNNEFNPSDWSEYVLTETIPEFPSLLVLPILMIAVAFGALLYRKQISQSILNC